MLDHDETRPTTSSGFLAATHASAVLVAMTNALRHRELASGICVSYRSRVRLGPRTAVEDSAQLGSADLPVLQPTVTAILSDSATAEVTDVSRLRGFRFGMELRYCTVEKWFSHLCRYVVACLLQNSSALMRKSMSVVNDYPCRSDGNTSSFSPLALTCG